MTLGDVARVARGVATGNRSLFIMTREEAKQRGLERFARPILGSVRDFPRDGPYVVRDRADREVVIVASRRDVEEHASLRDYLDGVVPRLATVRPAPIAASYVGIPRFVANPDGLIITNALYTVTPRQNMGAQEVLALVERLNRAMSHRARGHSSDRFTPRQLEAIAFE